MISGDQLRRAAAELGFPADLLEKAWMLVRLLRLVHAHPFMGPRVALKGGSALNLFVFDLPRLSVDIDLNYIGAEDLETMHAERPQLEIALEQVAGRLGLSPRRVPDEHAGGKWRLAYTSALGRSAILEVDINFMFRVPLWRVVTRDSHELLGERARQFRVVGDHELAAGKLAALLSRGASRDLFDARELLASHSFDRSKLRIAFVVYGGLNRIDWRNIATERVATTVEDVKRRLVPMLKHSVRPEPHDLARWTKDLIEETRSLIGALLPLDESELEFLERLNGRGEIAPALLTADIALQERISAHPGLRWKALNVQRQRL